MYLSVVSRQGRPGQVIVEVGIEKAQYYLPKAFLVHYSEYFDKALNGPWKESTESFIPLADVETAVFNHFVEWMYSQVLPEHHDTTTWKEIAASPTGDGHSLLMLKLYVFADRFLIPSLRALVNSRIVTSGISKYPRRHASEAMIYAFKNLPATDPVLDFFVDSYFMMWTIAPEDAEKSAKELSCMPQEFLVRWLIKLGTYRSTYEVRHERKFYMNLCSYHVHQSDPEKEQCPMKATESHNKILIEWKKLDQA